MSGAPAVTILLEIEAAPRVWIDSLNDAETTRLYDWINARDDLAELLAWALELAEREPAA